MRAKSIDLAQMGGIGYGKKGDSHSLIERSMKLSNLGVEILWYGAVWDGMVWEDWQR